MRPLIWKSTAQGSPPSATQNRRRGRDLDDGGELGEAHLGFPGTVEWVRVTAEA